MLAGIQNLITNPNIYNATQSTVSQVTTETCLKAVGRPSFILIDRQIDPQTKRFSAIKEFLYQVICLGIYLSVIIPVCRKGAYNLAKKMYKDELIFKAFPTTKELSKYYKMNHTEKAEKIAELNRMNNSGDKFTRENLNANLGKGAIEAGAMFGSVTGLAILAPIISHPLIHPIMNALFPDEQHKKV